MIGSSARRPQRIGTTDSWDLRDRVLALTRPCQCRVDQRGILVDKNRKTAQESTRQGMARSYTLSKGCQDAEAAHRTWRRAEHRAL